ncbi:MAG: hypothetical protein WBE74_25415, partial [Terracidiphilus sp.]
MQHEVVKVEVLFPKVCEKVRASFERFPHFPEEPAIPLVEKRAALRRRLAHEESRDAIRLESPANSLYITHDFQTISSYFAFSQPASSCCFSNASNAAAWR